jgi:hypothetical protein
VIILPTTRGIINRRIVTASVTYVGSAGVQTNIVPKPSGLAANDLMVIHIAHGNASISSGSTDWSKFTVVWTNYGYTSTLLWKVITAGDVSASISLTGISTNGVVSSAWRGPTSLALMATAAGSASASDTTLSITRTAKNVSSLGQVAFTADRDPSGAPQGPSGWATRNQYLGQFFQMTAYDRIDGSQPAGSGTDTFTNFTSGFDQAGFNCELRA